MNIVLNIVMLLLTVRVVIYLQRVFFSLNKIHYKKNYKIFIYKKIKKKKGNYNMIHIYNHYTFECII
jgi:hypothetical protein